MPTELQRRNLSSENWRMMVRRGWAMGTSRLLQSKDVEIDDNVVKP